MFVIVAVIEVKKPELVDPFLEVTLASARGAHGEPGCLRFDVVRSAEDSGKLAFYEVYRDRAAFDAHRARPYYQRWKETTAPWFADGSVVGHSLGGHHILSADPAYAPGG